MAQKAAESGERKKAAPRTRQAPKSALAGQEPVQEALTRDGLFPVFGVGEKPMVSPEALSYSDDAPALLKKRYGQDHMLWRLGQKVPLWLAVEIVPGVEAIHVLALGLAVKVECLRAWERLPKKARQVLAAWIGKEPFVVKVCTTRQHYWLADDKGGWRPGMRSLAIRASMFVESSNGREDVFLTICQSFAAIICNALEPEDERMRNATRGLWGAMVGILWNGDSAEARTILKSLRETSRALEAIRPVLEEMTRVRPSRRDRIETAPITVMIDDLQRA